MFIFFFFFFTDFVKILTLFPVLVFQLQACRIFVPPRGIKPTSPALEGNILTPGPLGSSWTQFSYLQNKGHGLENHSVLADETFNKWQVSVIVYMAISF